MKGSEKEKILYNLHNGKRYVIDHDQYEFLSLLDGKTTLKDLLKGYNDASQTIIKEFIIKLQGIRAVEVVVEPHRRKISKHLTTDPRLQSVHLEFTGQCNMQCAHCYQGSYLKIPNELTTSEIRKLVREMHDLGVDNVGISGGEPLMRNDLFEVIQMIEDNEMRISALFTNALLINKKTIENILKCRSHYSVFISLDAITSEGMKFRGFAGKEGGFALSKIINNIRLLSGRSISVVINTVLTKYNITHLFEMYNLMRSLKVQSWRIGFPKMTSTFKLHTHEFSESWETMAEASLMILRHHFVQRQPFHLQIEYLYREELFKNSGLPALSNNEFVCDYEGRRGECCIKPNGDVVSCAYCSDLPLGNIRQTSLKKIWYSKAMRNIKNIRIGDVDGCKECDLKPLCAVGCRANAYFLHGDFNNARDDYACEAVKFFVEKIKPLLKEKGILTGVNLL